MLTPIASSGPYIDTAIPFHFTGSATASAGPGGAYTILTTHAVGEGGTWHIGPLTPGVSQNVVVHTGNGTSIFRAAVTGGSATSASHNIMSGASVNTTLNFIPNTTFVDIEIADNSPFGGTNSIQVFGFTIDTVTYIPQTVVATITSGDDYHYGFNGKMKDNEWAGVGNSIDYGFRMLDTRIARFRGVDPLTAKYPMLTPYQFASNTPIWAKDLDGREAWFPRNYFLIQLGAGGNDDASVRKWNEVVLIPVLKHVGKETAIFLGGLVVGEVVGPFLGPVLEDEAGGAFVADATRVEPPVYSSEPVINNPTPQTAEDGGAVIKAKARAEKLSKTSRPGQDFTSAGKEAVKDVNKAENGGDMFCEYCGQKVQNAEQHTSGYKPPSNEAHVDHIDPKANGGSGTPNNGQVLCRGCNLAKGAKTN